MATQRRDAPLFTVSVAAELAGIHPQTVRQYDRLGLVIATRTQGGGRRYSLNDIERLQEIQRLSQEEGISLAGIARIFELQDENERLHAQVRRLRKQIEKHEEALAAEELARNRVFAAGADGDIYMASGHSELRMRLRELREQAERERRAEEERRADEAHESRASQRNNGTVVVWRAHELWI